MNYIAKVQDKEFKIELEELGDKIFVKKAGKSIPIQLTEIDGSHIFSALIGNRSMEIEIRQNEKEYLIEYQGNTVESIVEDERTAMLKKTMAESIVQKKENELKAPMPGMVISIEVELGQKVYKGDGLIVIEAMKMENEIKASFDTKIKEIKIKEGDAVDKNQLLLTFE